jgi:hypothetical protein
MKFNGKELHDLGVPKNKIKFFINKEFSSKEEMLAEAFPESNSEKKEKVYTWIDWLLDTFEITHLPMKMNGTAAEKMSKSELRRIFDSKSIRINQKFPTSSEECSDEDFPINDFVWFPKGKRITTWV